jgi:mycothiol system anti-sigma-R factor
VAKNQCDEALEKLYEYIDNELPDEELSRIGEHLKDCPPCESELRINEKIKTLASQCGGELAPTELRERILQTIAQERGEGIASA